MSNVKEFNKEKLSLIGKFLKSGKESKANHNAGEGIDRPPVNRNTVYCESPSYPKPPIPGYYFLYKLNNGKLTISNDTFKSSDVSRIFKIDNKAKTFNKKSEAITWLNNNIKQEYIDDRYILDNWESEYMK